MNYPPLRPLHVNTSLSQLKLNHYARLTTEELMNSLEPGRTGSLKTRSDGTIIDGHHESQSYACEALTLMSCLGKSSQGLGA